MPYEVSSQCSACSQGDDFVIGNWPEHLGVFLCGTCRAIVNVPLDSGQCGCGHEPAVAEYYDYARAIPYMRNDPSEELERGPQCPKCNDGFLVFDTKSHFNVGVLGRSADGKKPWLGRDYLEKAIFTFATIAACAEFDLEPEEILDHFSVDFPESLMYQRRLSVPIALDVRSSLIASVMAHESDFTVTNKMAEAIDREMEEIREIFEDSPRRKAWWQFWRRA